MDMTGFRAVVFGAALLCPMATQAASDCAPRATVVERLADRFGESRRAIGLGSDNVMIEVFASDASGSWTITVTSPLGMTCLLAAGQAFEAMAEMLPPDDSDA